MYIFLVFCIFALFFLFFFIICRTGRLRNITRRCVSNLFGSVPTILALQATLRGGLTALAVHCVTYSIGSVCLSVTLHLTSRMFVRLTKDTCFILVVPHKKIN